MAIKTTLILILFLFSSPLSILSEDVGFRVELTHIDSNKNFTQTELISRAMVRAGHRVSRLNSRQLFSSANVNTTIHSGRLIFPGFLMDLAIGTPAIRYSAVVDTGTDLIWTQCNPCKKCVYQPTPIYTPSKSSTFFPMCDSIQSCSYNYTYFTGWGWTSGVAYLETFTFGTVKQINITFGCSTSTSDGLNGTAGFVGLGRGASSLISQLNTSKFSYCLTSFLSNTTSPLIIGPFATLKESTVKSTPFVKNPSTIPENSYYYLSLKGISLGTTKLAITDTTFALNSDGTGGFIIDSGTTFTYLKIDAYRAVMKGIDSLVTLEPVNGSDVGLDLCYSISAGTSPPKSTMPEMTFHFDGADMVLPVENYMIFTGQLWCLAMSSSRGLSILGDYQQANIHILYDLEKNVLSFSPAQCDKL